MKSKFNHDVVQVKYTVDGIKKVKVFDLSLIELDQYSYDFAAAD